MTEKKFSLLGGYKAAQGIKKQEPVHSANELLGGMAKDILAKQEKVDAESQRLAAGDVQGTDRGGLPAAPENESAKAESVVTNPPVRTGILNDIAANRTPVPAVQPGVGGESANATALVPAKPSLLEGVKKAQERAEQRKEDHSYLFAEMPDDYQQLLDRFDNLLMRDGQIDLSNIDLCRAYVKKIMLDVKENPELEGLIIARDVRNVISFIRSVKGTAIQDLQTKKEKGTKRKETSAKKKANRFGDVGTIDLNAVADTLEDFSNIELDF